MGNQEWDQAIPLSKPKSKYDVIIIGGGGHGLATAYYLAKECGITNVAVLEKGYIGGGNTGRNTTIIRSNYLRDEASSLYEHSMRLWEGLSEDLNFNVMFSQRGVYNLGHTLQDMRDIERRVNANVLNGVDAVVVDHKEIKEQIPIINTSKNARYPIMGASFRRALVLPGMMVLLGDLPGLPQILVLISYKIVRLLILRLRKEELKALRQLKATSWLIVLVV